MWSVRFFIASYTYHHENGKISYSLTLKIRRRIAIWCGHLDAGVMGAAYFAVGKVLVSVSAKSFITSCSVVGGASGGTDRVGCVDAVIGRNLSAMK